MLHRDLPNDYCQKYIPTISKQTFFEQLQQNSARQKLYLTQRQLSTLNSQSIKTTRLIQGTVVASVIGFIMFNKLPVLSQIQIKPLKTLLRLGLLVLPTYTLVNTMIPKLVRIKQLTYQQQSKKYKDYLRSGDLLKINQQIVLTQN